MQSVQEMACFVNLWDAVQAIQLTDQPDSIRWKWTAHGDYSAKSAYNIQFAGSHGQFISSHIWQAESEGKHKFLHLAARAIQATNCGQPTQTSMALRTGVSALQSGA